MIYLISNSVVVLLLDRFRPWLKPNRHWIETDLIKLVDTFPVGYDI